MWDLVGSGASGDEPTLKLGERGGEKGVETTKVAKE